MKRTKPKLRPLGKSFSVEELAEQQGVAPVDDVQALADLWPVDDDPDELLRFILDERRARRQAHPGRK